MRHPRDLWDVSDRRCRERDVGPAGTPELRRAGSAPDRPFVAGGMVGLVLGGHLADRLPEHQLRLSFGVVVLTTAAYTFARSAVALTATHG